MAVTKQKKTKKATVKRSGVGRVVYWLTLIGLWAGIGVAGLVGYYALDLPDTRQLWQVENQPEFRFYGANDKPLVRRGRLNGRPLLFRDLPPHLVQAVIAIEDRRFYDHVGVDIRGLARAVYANFRAGGMVAGGSTLTQQLAKNVFLTPERTIKRKVQELLLSFWMEATLSKEDIITLYMNRVYFGAGAYGVFAAAETYFARPVQELTLGESAILAGLLKAPSRLAPTRNPDGARARAQLVLQSMYEIGAISEETLAEDPLSQVRVVTRSSDTAHYAIDWAMEQLPDFVGRPRTDLDIITTIDPVLQVAAEKAALQVLNEYGEARNVEQVAVVVMTPQGAIRALIGGRSYAQSQYNRAVLAKRQPGSAFKPIVYLAGLEAGMEPMTIMHDGPISIEDWSPQNYNGEYNGDVSLTEALANSLNTVAVQVTEQAGRERVIDVARRTGITSHLYPHPSIALGVFEVSLLELTTVYATIANNGFRTFPYVIEDVISSNGDELYTRVAGSVIPAISTENVNKIQDMLVSAVERGTGRAAQVKGLRVGGKTGTTQNWRDAWFVGMTGDLVVGVWVGNDDATPMKRVTGGFMPAQIWHNFVVAQQSITDTAPIGLGESAPQKRRGLFDWLFGE